jgi:O-antigen/teichoic acid export membrane protein
MITKLKLKLSKDMHLVELLKGSSISFGLKVFGMLLGYISMLFITNIYGAKEFGILSLIITIISIFAIIPKFGMENALIRMVGELFSLKQYEEIPRLFKKVFFFTLLLSIIFSVCLFLISKDIAVIILDKEYLSTNLKTATIAVATSTMITIMAATLQGLKKTKEFIFIHTVLLQLVFLLFLICDYYFSLSSDVIKIYVYSNITTSIISIYVVLKFLKKIKTSSETKTTKFNFINVLSIAFPMLLSGSFAMIMGWTDIVMLGIYKTEADVGIYSAAQRVAALTSLSLIAINSIAAPKFIEFYSKKDYSGLEKIAKQSTKIIFYTSFPLLLAYLIFPEYIMSFFGDEFTAGATVLVLISVAQFVNAVSGSVGYITQMTDNQKVFSNILLIAAILNVVLNYSLIPIYGINGAAFATMVSLIFWNTTLVIFIKYKLGFWTVCLPSFKRIKIDG